MNFTWPPRTVHIFRGPTPRPPLPFHSALPMILDSRARDVWPDDGDNSAVEIGPDKL